MEGNVLVACFVLFFKCLMSSKFKTLAYQLLGGGTGRKKE